MNAKIRLMLLAAALAAMAFPAGADDELVWKDGKWVHVAPPAEGTAAGELAIVRHDIDNRNLKAAVKHAKRFLKRYADSPLCEAALSLAGDAELGRCRHWQAYQWYEKQLVRYPNGQLADRAMDREIEIAEAFLAGKKRPAGKVFRISGVEDGLEILQRIAERVPGSDRAELAMLAIGDHYFNKQDWLEAAESFDRFLKMFPKSKRAPTAELRAAEAYHSSYRGPDFDETPLVEAEQRYKSFLASRPREAAKRGVRDTLAEVRNQRAGKHYHIARFYLRTKHPKAATQYLRRIVKDYPDTDWAGQALDRLAEIDPAAAEALAPPAPAGKPAGGTPTVTPPSAPPPNDGPAPPPDARPSSTTPATQPKTRKDKT